MAIDPFDLNTSQIGEPLCLVIGKSHQWRREIDIDPNDFEIKYELRRFVPVEGAPALDQTISLVNIDSRYWGVDLLPADISTWDLGKFYWDLVVTRTSDDRIRTIDNGQIEVFATDADRRSHAEIMVAKIESVLENRADSDVESYSIKSRSITKLSLSDLRMWREYYFREITNSNAKDNGVFASRKAGGSTVRIRLLD